MGTYFWTPQLPPLLKNNPALGAGHPRPLLRRPAGVGHRQGERWARGAGPRLWHSRHPGGTQGGPLTPGGPWGGGRAPRGRRGWGGGPGRALLGASCVSLIRVPGRRAAPRCRKLGGSEPLGRASCAERSGPQAASAGTWPARRGTVLECAGPAPGAPGRRQPGRARSLPETPTNSRARPRGPGKRGAGKAGGWGRRRDRACARLGSTVPGGDTQGKGPRPSL